MESMRVTIRPGGETRDDVRASSVAELLRELGLHQDAHLVIRGEEILTRDVRLDEGDSLEIIPVISGGAPCAA